MIVPHRKHVYESPRPVTRRALLTDTVNEFFHYMRMMPAEMDTDSSEEWSIRGKNRVVEQTGP
jgi:hypothetical protein